MNIRKSAVFASIVGGSLVAGVAFAAWTADGTGSGYAQAKTAQAVSTAETATVAALYPGATGDLKVSVVNPNDYAVQVTAISGNGTITSSVAACDTGGHGVTFDGATGLTNIVPAHSTGTVITLANKVHMSNSSVTDCSGATFTVPVSISAASYVAPAAP